MNNETELSVNEVEPAVEAAAEPKKAPRTRRKAAPKADDAVAAPPAAEAVPDDAPAAVATPETADAPAAPAKAAARRPRARKKTDAAEPLPAFAIDADPAGSGAAAGAADAGADTAAEAAAAGEVPAEQAETKPVRRRRVATRKAAPAGDPAETQASAETPAAAQEPPAAVALDAETEDRGAVARKAAVQAAVTTAAEQEPDADEATAGPAQATGTAVPAAAGESATTPGEAAPAAGEAAEEPGAFASLFLEPASPTSVLFQAPDLSTVVRPAAPAAADQGEDQDDAEDNESEESSGRRRRRSRGRRGRSRLDDREDAGTDGSDADGASDESDEDETGPAEDGVTSRRRRRRRRGDQDLELTGGEGDDPPNTVTRVRAPRAVSEAPASNRVTSVKGSTRLEAKKQRRRESRDTGRRRTVITEAEFLARRESVDRQMIVRQRDDRIQIGVLEDGVLAEHFVSKTQQDSLIGNVYLGKVQNVLPSMEAAFVDIGRGRNAVLYAGEVNWEAVNLEGKQRRIENALKSGDTVLVQVTKDPVGHKGARLTSQISLPGRYLVYVPGGSMTGISRKLPDVERNRLKRILKDRLPEQAGVIVRTAAEGASEEELTHDINRLRAQWEGIESQSSSTKVLAPELLYGEPDLTIKVVRDVFNEDFSKLIVSGEEAWDTIEAYVTYVAPDLVGRLEKWTKDQDIFAAWRIDEQIHKALERKVFLPSGGSLVIDRTEAMTVVDVNTGKFTGSGGNLEETVTKNNLEAAEEVVRQLRLRDIGGIIVIDFIDMVLESNRDLVLRRMVECLGRDRTKHQVAEVTSLGLVQMTRKRMGTGLLEVFGEQCEACAGRGVVTHDDPVEHRRANIVAAEQHVHRSDARPSGNRNEGNRSEGQRNEGQRTDVNQEGNRGERKRRRGRGGQAAEPAPAPAAVAAHPVQPDPHEAERHAKAEATRLALANIAAAAHAAHLHDDEVAARQTPALQDAGTTEKHDDGMPARPAAVLTFGGEKVALPFVEHADEHQASPALSLDRLAEAFAHLGQPASPVGSPSRESGTAQAAPAAPEPAEEVASAPRQPVAAAAPARELNAAATADPSRQRRPRRNRSASRAQGAANATTVEHHESVPAASEGHSHAAKAPEPAAPAEPAAKADAPIILGVGVPASEL
ncbi:ribonuclease, Rne/Rng family [Pseudarthrobacter chlorophenolicus A6]|uniref:Ribonuclease E n=1 Tax=Pseudarthrobacter chlorophenolicus (strain ATCC 700700 / DSM 12829 / CIP 107037 / JCM 12360 / KCTC 9906 / NCIMB 13794 / A6) TaxID=452863 RepID=B8HA23_PSECP|nr:Rne/Rng family ribonuclease [Pseudarthrobacter chlorophenolicus]ACL40115.1 ribonuclease, Rne/Rng family [Pseudarthrobacter chlorophenolicus A6]SDQ87546.1 ribonuclease E [Pseudarthrobacter chlorophenolicus]